MIDWFRENNSAITWFIIGWLSFAVVDSLTKENWTMALVDSALIYLNYRLWKSNNA